MHDPNPQDINRIYEGFNEAYGSEPGRFDFMGIEPFCDNDNGVRLGLNSDVAKGYWDLFRANGDLLICIADGMYVNEYRQTILPRQDVITLRFILSGALRLSSTDGLSCAEALIPQACASILYMPKDKEFDLQVGGGSHLRSVTIHMDPKFLYASFGVDPQHLPTNLADVLYDRKFDNSPYNLPLTPGMMNNILDLVNMPYTGARRRLFTEAKTAELVCQLFQEVERDRVSRPLASTPGHVHKTQLFEAQKILVANYASPPTIAELARQTGLNRSALSAEFKEIFGTTIFEFCQDFRMNKARERLLNSDLSIAQVAESIGYDHPTNFSSAFKKHYGILPKQLRPLDRA